MVDHTVVVISAAKGSQYEENFDRTPISSKDLSLMGIAFSCFFVYFK